MHTLVIVLLILAAISFALAAASIAAPRVNLVALGLLAWVLALLVPQLV